MRLNTLEQTWRWFGPDDPLDLEAVRQTGAEGVVTALHSIPNGEVWPLEAIEKHQRCIAQHDLVWSVVESVPVHEDIKLQTGDYRKYIDNYALTLENLGRAGIRTVCYNFMPALDWTRTDLDVPLPDGSRTLGFSLTALAAFDLYILERPGADASYSKETVAKAKRYFETLSDEDRKVLERSIIAGLPGAEETYTKETLRRHLLRYQGIDEQTYAEHLYDFLRAVIPRAEAAGVCLAVHPDDPPISLFGLPRILSRLEDYRRLFQSVPSPNNGMSLCTGSLGAGRHNTIEAFVEAFAKRIHFLHLRNIAFINEVDFYESGHLDGDLDMVAVLSKLVRLLSADKRRIPVRPDHGPRLLDDLTRPTRHGYAGIGRMRGLAEIRGMVHTLERPCGSREK